MRRLATKSSRLAIAMLGATAALATGILSAGPAAAAPAADTGSHSARLVASPALASRRADATTTSCPVPGQRVKISSSDMVFLVDPDYHLYYVPNDVYFKLWDSYSGIVTNDNLWNCYWGSLEFKGGELAKESWSQDVYIYDYYGGGYRWITSPDVFNKYGFSWSKIKSYGYKLEPKSGNYWDF